MPATATKSNRRRVRKLTPTDDAMIVDLYNQGWSQVVIAQKMKVSQQAVSKAILRFLCI